MVDRGSIVRESKFRHVFGKAWKKELCFTDVKLQSSTNQSNSIRVSDKYFSVPWQTAGGGSFIVVPLGLPGPRIPYKWPILNAHSSPLTDIQFHPFNDIITTCARDSEVKFWSLTEQEGLNLPPILDHIGSINLTSRGNILKYHPSVDNLLATSSADNNIQLWDVQNYQQISSITTNSNEPPNDVQWSLDGSLLGCSFQKEQKVKLFDARQNQIVKEFLTNNGVKGTCMSFMENNKLITVGFNKANQNKRMLSIWDISMIDESNPQPIASKSVAENNLSAILIPNYDPANGICYLTGRGNSIFYYEINNENEMIHTIGSCQTSISYTAAVPVAKRLLDIYTCELQRFYSVSSDVISITSIHCPRKASNEIFQEDLYPGVPSNKPSLTIPEYLKGETQPIQLVSIKPPQMKSVFDLSIEEGGKSKVEEVKKLKTRSLTFTELKVQQIIVKKVPEISAGKVQLYTNGWIRKWEYRWIELTDNFVNCYSTEDSPIILFAFAIPSITSVESSSEFQITNNRLFVINSETDKKYFYCTSSELCEKWIKSINLVIEQNKLANNENQSQNRSFDQIAFVSGGDNNEEKQEEPEDETGKQVKNKQGKLDVFTTGYIYNGWVARWLVLDSPKIFIYKAEDSFQKGQPSLECINLQKVISVDKLELELSESQFRRKYVCKLSTASRIIYLSSQEENTLVEWMKVVSLIVNPDNSFLLSVYDNQDDNQDKSIELQGMKSYVLKKNSGLFGLLGKKWTKYYLTVAGDRDLLYFNTSVDTTTRLRIAIQSITNIVHNDNILLANQFILQTTDKQQHLHQTDTVEEKEQWIQYFCQLKKKMKNYFDEFQLSDEEINAWKLSREQVDFIDPIDIKNGKVPVGLKVKGKRKIRIKLVPPTAEEFNEVSVFVLDCGKTIYQWNGKFASRIVKAKAWDVIGKIRQKERGGVVNVVNLDQGNDNVPEFWTILGGKPAYLLKPIEGDAEKKKEQLVAKQMQEDTAGDPMRIYRILDENLPKEQRIKLIYEGTLPPPKEYLQFNSVCVIDSDHEIYIWTGRNANNYQRKLGSIVAMKLRDQRDKGAYLFISKVIDKGETILFKEKFSNYPGMLPIQVNKDDANAKPANIAQSKEQQAIDFQLLHNYDPMGGINFTNDYTDTNIAGKIVKFYKIEGFEKKEIPAEFYGQLWSADSFIIVYEFPYGNKFKTILYYWQGKFSSINEKGTSAYITVDISNNLQNFEQVRVVQDKENLHFLKFMRKYNFMVHLGKYDENNILHKNYTANKARLFTIRGDYADGCRPVEIPASHLNLHSLHSFVLLTGTECFIWNGQFANDFEMETAKQFAALLNKPITVGNERASDQSAPFKSFWSSLGGTTGYYGSDNTITQRRPIRLFTCVNITGSIQVDEIHSFSQEDTQHYTKILILDTFRDIFLWFGARATEAEKKFSIDTAQQYVNTSPNHAQNTPIWVVYPYSEPNGFYANFPTWSRTLYPLPARNSTEEIQLPAEQSKQ